MNTLLNPHVFFWLSAESFEYTHQILDGNKIEPPYMENYNMQIITS